MLGVDEGLSDSLPPYSLLPLSMRL